MLWENVRRLAQSDRSLGGFGRSVPYLRQGRVPSFVRSDDPPALEDELAAVRRADDARGWRPESG